MAEAKDVVCPDCGTRFVCGVAAGRSTCWCMERPLGLPLPEGAAQCYCGKCLEQRVSDAAAASARAG